ncbi:hypothetical protein CC99x_012045 [Candidatus Berkiella cookevillensis]|uniref:Cytoplasmic glycerophosphodiester phosphodiesterase n=1 Tax=Candidatus Berkiella cookevillensis TaxID=437022 RepID=A0A0Q9YQC5_9GAMM|nr:glycerophosphodiester phosphodiesterase family protein [Candidatus Berkiella cookevillensis]MCS5709627.1 hypothetical protein [Candidatus Berkiella cookevillensis]
MRYSFSNLITSLVFSILTAVPLNSAAVDNYAHRGGAGLSPENTLEGIEKSLRLKIDVIDMDIGITQDNVIVLYHDTVLNPDITRNTKQEWLSQPGPALKHLSYRELQQYDVGKINPQSLYANELPAQQSANKPIPIPTLQQAIQLIQTSSKPVRLQIEIKTDPDPSKQSATPEQIVPTLITLLRKKGIEKNVEIHSFDWRNLILLQKLAPEITTSYLSADEILDHSNYVRWHAGNDIKALQQSYPALIKQLGGKIWCPHYQELTPDLLKEAHQLNLKVNVWTVDSPDDMLHMVEMGVDGIITNRPDLLAKLLSSNNKASS